MRMYDIIEKKRNGFELSDEEIKFFIDGFTLGDIPDYQASALMMAIYFRGMSERETVTLTLAMADSGDRVDLSEFGSLSVDKHSTGGVGDKTSLIVAPIVASLGAKVTKMSGRGLGHTGGTVDKLESIPGYKTTLSKEDFFNQIKNTGIAVIGQSGNLTPADKKLYALRDVTATVESIPLITSSIMSKKIAAGSHSIVLDVKVGSGAFMKDLQSAEILAREMVKIGKMCGRNIAAVLSDMDAPLGTNIGNSLEVVEAVKVLKNELHNDLYEVCVTLATQMVCLSLGYTPEKAKDSVINAIESGSAFNKMKQWIAAQGGDISYLEDVTKFPKAELCYNLTAETDAYIAGFDSEKIGLSAVCLGAGRATKEDSINHAAGIVLNKKPGDKVTKGETIAALYTDEPDCISSAAEMFNSAVSYSENIPEAKPLIYQVIR